MTPFEFMAKQWLRGAGHRAIIEDLQRAIEWADEAQGEYDEGASINGDSKRKIGLQRVSAKKETLLILLKAWLINNYPSSSDYVASVGLLNATLVAVRERPGR